MQSPGELGMDQATAEASCVEEGTDWLDPVTGDVLMQVMTELANMTSMLGRAAARRRIGEIQGLVRALLHQVAQLIMAGEIDPWTRLRMTPDDPPVSPSADVVRIGVLPLSANPIHWGHLLSGLSVMVRARLDKIVYLICHDPSPATELYPEELRRGAAAVAIALFQPLFTLVPAQAGKSLDGPASFFRLLGLNGQQTVEAFYVSGYESGASISIIETMEALHAESNRIGAGHNERLHPVSLVRMDAAAGEGPASGNPRLLVIPSPLPWVSTSAVRAALSSSLHRDELSALPACAFLHLRMLSSFD